MQKGYIYIIRNSVNDKVYVGSTYYSIHRRLVSHLNGSANGDSKMQRAIREIGRDKFFISLIKTCHTKEQLTYSERFFVKYYKSNNSEFGYNTMSGGENTKTVRGMSKIQAYVTDSTKEAVIELAKKEGRSESNTAGKLLDEAILTNALRTEKLLKEVGE